MRMGATRAGRAALGAAAAAGVKHMAHRFIVGETPHAARGVLRGLWARRRRLVRRPARRGDGDRGRGRPLRGTLRGALDELAGVYAPLDPRPLLEPTRAGPMPRVNLSVKVSALTPLLRPDAPELGQRDAAERLRPLLRAARDAGAHLHIDMERWTRARRSLDLVLGLLAEDEFRPGRRPGWCSRPTCVTRLSCSTGSLAWARSAGARAR